MLSEDKLQRRSVGRWGLMTLCLLVLLIIGTSLVGATILSDGASASKVLNIAGRQRMLTQRLVAECQHHLLNASHDRADRSVTGEPSHHATADTVGEVISEFESVLNDLRAAVPSYGLPPAHHQAASDQLDEVYRAWRPLRQRALGIASASEGTSSSSDSGAIAEEIFLAGTWVLAEMEQAVSRLESGFEARLMRFQVIFAALLIASIVTSAILTILVLIMWRQRQQTAARLIAANREMQTLLDVLDECVILAITDSKGRITYANRKFCELSGYSQAELLGQDHRILNSGYHDRSFWRDMYRAVRRGESWRGEIRNRAKNGAHYWVDTTIRPIMGEDGRPEQIVAVRLDITERKEAEAELRHIGAGLMESLEQQSKISAELEQARENLEIRNRELNSAWQEADMARRQTQAILDAASEMAIIATDEHGTITVFNRGAKRMFGYAEEDVVHQWTPEIFHLESELAARREELIGDAGREPSGFEVLIHDALQGRHIEREWTLVGKDGRRLTGHVLVTAICNEHDVVTGYLGIVRDVTTQKRNESKIRQLSQAVEQSPTSVIITDVNGVIEYVNPAFSEVTGYTQDEVIGQTPRILKSGRQTAEHYREMWRTLSAGCTWRGELQNRRKNGEIFWELAVISPLTDSLGRVTHYVAVKEDISTRKRMEEELQIAARTDRLTGLVNRSLLLDRLQQAIDRSRRMPDYRFAVLFLDFDRFKIINDSLGHESGDLLLREIADRLRSAVRTTDSISCDVDGNTVARIGGDEFVVILDAIRSSDDAVAVADRLLDVFSAPYRLGENEVSSTASIGIVTSDISAPNAEDLLRDADMAMYEAKASGKGRAVMFDRSMRERIQERMLIENELRRAISHDQLSLLYQPIISLETGALHSVEALVRWTHPQRGLIMPVDFIPIAEETGMIIGIGEWILKKACSQLVAWRHADPESAPRLVSVNLSRSQLEIGDFPSTLERITCETGIEPEALQLEITERDVTDHRGSSAAILQQIRDFGIRLAMDDFGTGHSSLACLQEFPFDTLKIDREFLSNLDRGRDFAAMVQAVTTLGQNLGMSIVAEGVETSSQLAALQSLGCQYGQGFLFSGPVASDEIPGLAGRAGSHDNQSAA